MAYSWFVSVLGGRLSVAAALPRPKRRLLTPSGPRPATALTRLSKAMRTGSEPRRALRWVKYRTWKTGGRRDAITFGATFAAALLGCADCRFAAVFFTMLDAAFRSAASRRSSSSIKPTSPRRRPTPNSGPRAGRCRSVFVAPVMAGTCRLPTKLGCPNRFHRANARSAKRRQQHSQLP
jgi:hypothetical protein